MLEWSATGTLHTIGVRLSVSNYIPVVLSRMSFCRGNVVPKVRTYMPARRG